MRLTVTDAVHYGPSPGNLTVDGVQLGSTSPPASQHSRFDRILVLDEQAYQRLLDVADAWADLDTGWVTLPASMVMVQNQAPPYATSADRKTKTASPVLALAVGDTTFAYVYPGESCRFTPAPGANYKVRAVASPLEKTPPPVGSVRASLFVVPH
jgi:hypothetical protein